jgi:SAM-dependent methyltransferase
MTDVQPAERNFASQYDDAERTARILAKTGGHRNIVGAMWDEMGQLQLDFLKSQGLQPDHKFLDVGCGSLRAGVKIIPYLDPNNYYGIDAEKQLLDKGYSTELKLAGIEDRLSRDHLYCSRLFKHERLDDGIINFGICNSVITHLPINFLRICLENTARYFQVGGKLFITFFEVPISERFSDPWTNPKGIKTTGFRDPYHYYAADMLYAAERSSWSARYIGDWNHPRGQNIIEYTRQ